MILLLISFIAGVLTILAPCTLPILPIIIGSTVSGVNNRKKAFVIAGSLAASIIIFTLILKVSTAFIDIPPTVWAIISGTIIIVFGLISLFPNLWDRLRFVNKLSLKSNKVMNIGSNKESTYGDIIIGASLGPVFSTCSPTYFVILATVLPQSFLFGLLCLVVYTIGLSGMLLLIAFVGQRFVGKLGNLADPNGWFKKGLGVLFIIVGVGIMFGIDKKIQRSILDAGLFDVTKVEQKILSLDKKNNSEVIGTVAPELVSPDGYINTDGQPITIAEFKGKKVILLDVWTYSCINCQRTLPYVNAWYEKYKDKGLVVIGLHTPEFAFEKVEKNVEEAVRKFNVKHPVVLDNSYQTWNAYGNQYWPRKYLIDEEGNIVYDHIGEGEYLETERAIQMALLKLNATRPEIKIPTDIVNPNNVMNYESSRVNSKEVYFGSARNLVLENGKAGVLGTQTFVIPQTIIKNKLYLEGTWNFTPESAMSKTKGKILYKYDARSVYMVASSEKPITTEIYIDGKKVKDIVIQANELYTLVDGNEYGEHTLEIRTGSPGLEAFTFTFG
ncbi:MAG: redoxin family protein [Patescibacteria group bacterium]